VADLGLPIQHRSQHHRHLSRWWRLRRSRRADLTAAYCSAIIEAMSAEPNAGVMRRAAVHAALGDPGRLAIVDALVLGEASPTELQELLGMPSNLLAHHVRVLERVGVVSRHRSEADRRRTYLALAPGAFDALRPVRVHDAVRVVFVCTHNSARSQLAAALWNDTSPVPAASAGTHPAPAVHPGAVAAAHRHRVPLVPTAPRHLDDVLQPDTGADELVITVCDAAHEELAGADRLPDPVADRLHWSIPDPSRTGEDSAFDRVVTDLADRIARVAPAVRSTNPRRNTAGGPDVS
jgi:ArsR family transcriptional regulator, arsenate/arsenite/antimonite-responsive transcriptional repressor / arsenate reductase (thioredoxin)